jgi:hypothetical protein
MAKEALEKRIRTGKTSKVAQEDKERVRIQKIKERFEFEKGRTGGYELIFPNENEEDNKLYELFLQKANDLWDDFTTGSKNKRSKEDKSNQ